MTPLAAADPAEHRKPTEPAGPPDEVRQRAVPVPVDTEPPRSRQELVEAFASRTVLKLAPDAAISRFAGRFTFEREAENADGLLLVGRSPDEELTFDYSADGKGGFVCLLAALRLFVANPTQSSELERDLAKQLTLKFGKARRYPSAPQTPYWKVAGRVEASLGAYEAMNNGAPRRGAEIRISESDGP